LDVNPMMEKYELEYKPFGLFADRLMEIAQDWFATLYKRVSQQYWNNGVYGCVKRPYYMCNFDDAIAEYYVPTALNCESFMQFHRIVISILPEIDEAIYESELKRLLIPFTSPMGLIDSTTIFVISPKVTNKHKLKVKLLKHKAMLKIKRNGRTFIIPIVSHIPEIAFKKIVKHIVNFWHKRIQAFLNALKIQPWQYGYKVENVLSITINYFNRVIEKYNPQIIHVLRSMVAHFTYFKNCLTETLKSIGKINEMKAKLSRFAEIVHVLEPAKRLEIMSKIEECIISIKNALQTKRT